jgi:hypothetical protein
MCFERFDDSENFLSQYAHWNGLSPECVRLWIVSAPATVNALSHPGKSHLCGSLKNQHDERCRRDVERVRTLFAVSSLMLLESRRLRKALTTLRTCVRAVSGVALYMSLDLLPGSESSRAMTLAVRPVAVVVGLSGPYVCFVDVSVQISDGSEGECAVLPAASVGRVRGGFRSEGVTDVVSEGERGRSVREEGRGGFRSRRHQQ